MKNIALIGYGYWGKILLRYLEEQFNIVCVFGRSLEKEGIFTNRISDAFTDKIDAVVIATPINTHYEIVVQALKAGKNVLCEKPLTQHSAEIEKLMKLAEKRKLILMTEFTYTFSTGLHYAKNIIMDDGIGKLIAMELSLKKVGRFLKFDVYWLLASHLLSILDMFVPLNELRFKKFDIIHGETGVIFFNGRIRGQIFVSLNDPHRDSKVVFHGDKGTLTYNPLSKITNSVIRYGQRAGTLADKFIVSKDEVHCDESNNLRHAVCYFADTIEADDIKNSNLERAFQVTHILEMLETA